MLNAGEVAAIAKPILERAIAPVRVNEIRVDEVADSEGNDALQIVAVADRVASDTVAARADASADIQQALGTNGEPRFAFIRFTEPGWLEERARTDDDA